MYALKKTSHKQGSGLTTVSSIHWGSWRSFLQGKGDYCNRCMAIQFSTCMQKAPYRSSQMNECTLHCVHSILPGLDWSSTNIE